MKEYFFKQKIILLLFVLMGIVANMHTVNAATFAVTTTNDTSDAELTNNVCADSSGACSLRAAIEQANGNDESDTITIPAGEYILTQNFELLIESDMTISGSSSDETIIDAHSKSRVFNITYSATVELNNMSITGGKVEGDDSYAIGGGIYNNGELHLNRCAIIYNIAKNYGWGGGIYNDEILYITQSQISNNTSTKSSIDASYYGGGNGGGIYNNRNGQLFVESSAITDNVAEETTEGYGGYGGGIYNETDSIADIRNSIIARNEGRIGSAIDNEERATLTMSNSLIFNNIGTNDSDPTITAGGYHDTSTITIQQSIISYNYGVGVRAYTDSDSSARINLEYSLVTNNTMDCSEEGGGDATIRSYGYNIDSDNTCGFAMLGDMSGVNDVGLEVEYINFAGSSQQTLHLFSDSVAKDAIPTGGCRISTDYRGMNRPQGAGCDIGAYELAQDDDLDGYHEETALVDCNDADSTIHPGADESTVNGIDNDCDMSIDEDVVSSTPAPDSSTTPTPTPEPTPGTEPTPTPTPTPEPTPTEEPKEQQETEEKTVAAVKGATNGNITVTYSDERVVLYPIFTKQTERKTKVKRVNDTLVIVLSAKGKSVALVNAFTGEVLDAKKLSAKKTFTTHAMQIQKIRKKKTVLLTSSNKKKQQGRVVFLKFLVKKNQFGKPHILSFHTPLKVKKTRVKKARLTVQNNKGKKLATYLITKKFQAQAIE
ncbi:MAG TPA: putative metal-binding motif-containing protein [Patescibacteria group bacterium]|nr:putative metal-binding motif-containing protein [Patescibacteria group bacterium]